MNKTLDPNKIEDLLPQTQCKLCTYDGCRPYAEAIAHNNETINRCPPGGVRVLKKLAELTGKDATPYIEEMKKVEKPPLLAVIREDECIGCTKCIRACPTDAILGTGKLMHTVITDECTGCELCVEPCPVDCIDMIEIPQHEENIQQQKSEYWRKRYYNRKTRLIRDEMEAAKAHREAKKAKTDKQEDIKKARQSAIQAAIARTKTKK